VAYSERTGGSRAASARRAGGSHAVGEPTPFFLYVEGPHDQEILRSWARRLSRPLERAIDGSTVILGGRQPARALEHFRREVEHTEGTRGVCVLDRDDREEPLAESEPGLEFFTWPRRHIESYLLVPSAIHRLSRGGAGIDRIEALIHELASSERHVRDPKRAHAKRLLAPKGPLARELGRGISAAGVARAMRCEEIHDDVHDLFDRVYAGAGLRAPETGAVHKRPLPG